MQNRGLDVPAPRNSINAFKRKYGKFECPEEHKRQIFEDTQVQQQPDGSRMERVEGWSFVNVNDQHGEVMRQPGMLGQQPDDHH